MSYEEVVERIARACDRADRESEEITLVAVSKTKSVDEIMKIYAKGHRDFGENRAQELQAKAPDLPADINWHFIGALQSNKARMVRPRTHLLHSMDRMSLARSWVKGEGPTPPVLVEVNVGAEDQKAGVRPDEAGEFVERLIELDIDVRGVMAIPPIPVMAEDSRPYFAALRDLRDDLASSFPSIVELSMGMTDDFEVAVEEGASMIRVGRAIFGARN